MNGSADRSFRVLIIGGGSIGQRHARCFLKTGRARVSVCDTRAAVLNELSSQYPLAATFSDLESALEVPHDVAVVATPAPLHIPMARRLIEAGCHVLIEKPLSTSQEGIDQLKSEAQQHARVVGVAYVMRHNPGIVALREQVRRGSHGPPLEVVYHGGQDFPFFRPAYREIYYRDRATGGGAIQDALTHIVNAVEWIVGPVRAVAADAAHLALEGVDVEDTVHVMARHGDLLASYALNQHQPPNESVLQINCRDASLRAELHANCWKRMKRGETQWQTFHYEFADRDVGFVAQANAFLDSVAGGQNVACSVEEAEQTLRCCLAILKAADHRCWVSLTEGEAEKEG